MGYYHGISTRQVDTSVSTPVTAGSGIVFAVGAAPAHTVNGKTNEPILCYNYNEAVAALGYSDDWEKYPLCEVMYSQFKLYGISPVLFVNVLDSVKHAKEVATKKYTVTEKKVMLPQETLLESVKFTTPPTPGYVRGTDYELFYRDEYLILEILDGGKIPSNTVELDLSFRAMDPTALLETDLIGGFDTTTKKSSGFELIDSVFPKYGIVVDLLLAPRWSQKPTVAAIMSAKAEHINGVFEGKALIDVDTTAVKYYTDVPMWKKTNNINSKIQILCFPKVKLGTKIFCLSTQLAGVIGKTDTNNGGCPAESPSNKQMQANSAVLTDGTEVLLDLQQANFLNSNGIATVLNFMGGYVLWANETACYPADTDVKNYFICVSRMFGWVANSLVLTYWSKVDQKMNRRLIDSIVDSINIWMNGLVAQEQLLGGRVEYKEEENSDVALRSGKIVLHLYMTPPSPTKEVEFVLEYDANYVAAALAG